MDQRVRIGVAFSVMLTGVLLALLFRNPIGRMARPIPGTSDPLVLRKDSARGPAAAVLDPAQDASYARGPGDRGHASPTVLRPLDDGTLPPDLAKSYAWGPRREASRWGVSLGQMLPEPGRAPAATTHKIVDGDTLSRLAERYLGSADRATEIFEANRDVLSHPQILPIGAELRIPPQERAAPPAQASAPGVNLVPVQRPPG
jgi:nucleoid-associated protein YgaU